MHPKATSMKSERGRSSIVPGVLLMACAWIFLWCAFDNANAQIPTYGNLQAQEYGDAVYRELGFWGSIGLDYNHTGVFAGIDSPHAPKAMEAKGEAGIFPTGDDTTVE